MSAQKTSIARDEQVPRAPLAEVGLNGVIGYQLAQASITAAQIFTARVGEVFDLRPIEFTILSLIHENPGISARQLASTLCVTPPNISMLVDKLETRGLVERERNRIDRRAQNLQATARGSAMARKTVRAILEGEQAQLSSLSTAERAMLLELLHKAARCR